MQRRTVERKALRGWLRSGDVDRAVAETQAAIDDGLEVQDILDKGLIAAMDEVGQRFSAGNMFVPEMLQSARAMQMAMQLIRPLFTEDTLTAKGNVLIGTVKGDLHDIGKNLVAMMLRGAGFEVEDLKIDVAPETFVEAAKGGAKLVCLSALLTTTMPQMKNVIEELGEKGLRGAVKVMVGGAPLTQEYADSIGAAGYSPDAPGAVDLANKLLK